MAQPLPLDGIRTMIVIDRPAGAVAAELLGAMGAEIVRDGEADIVLASPEAMLEVDTKRTVRCDISAAGAAGCDALNHDAPDILLQAWGGLMAATGEVDGPPLSVNVPLIDVFAGINAATASLAALRQIVSGAPAPGIDIALTDTSAGLLGTFIAHVLNGKKSGFRDGCRHPICSPWNAYVARDGFVMICSSSDAQWLCLLELIGAVQAKDDPRFKTMAGRIEHMEAVDALVASWTAGVTVAAAVEAASRAGIPASPIRTPGEALADVGASLAEIADGREGAADRCYNAPFRLSAGPKGRKSRAPSSPLPLSGIRVLEIGPFTAGPLGGRLLAELGADVVKVEPPNGEVSRRWTPGVGGQSSYFANYNAGKRSIGLDLASPADREIFEKLLGTADVLLQNLKSGALEKFGFGASAALQRHPGLIYCSISGYGANGPPDPALDTVIQAGSGIMGLVEHGKKPCKVGFSVADLIAGHLVPFGVIAALRHRDRTQQGLHIDLSMLHALFWSTRFVQGVSAGSAPAFCRLQSADGWVVALSDEATAGISIGGKSIVQSSSIIMKRLAQAGIASCQVRDLGAVVADPLLERRGMLRRVEAVDGSEMTILGAPYGLARSRAAGTSIGPVDGDRDQVLRDWLHQGRLPQSPEAIRAGAVQ